MKAPSEQPAWLSRLSDVYRRRQALVEWAYWPVVQISTALLDADSVVKEYARRGTPIPSWEPYCWELSSAASMLLCVGLIILFNRRFSLDSVRIGWHLLAHLGFTVVISLIHVVGMVLLRELVYRLMGGNYDFGDWGGELWYEYRKDFVTYLGVLVTIYVYRVVASRLISEASPITDTGDAVGDNGTRTERFLVRKLGKDFLLRSDQIEWIEAAGNYMNLHARGRVFPIRETMAALEQNLNPQNFARVHRSYIVNLDHVVSMRPEDSGDGVIQLADGSEVKLSRRYRENFLSRAQRR
ncbi:MAG: LytTR family DNA-binding domain-containing protein [Xanthomonadales bacterium]|nr:LytTR family DNA-binding domain-containing protein [Xanthomonadales bacterium]